VSLRASTRHGYAAHVRMLADAEPIPPIYGGSPEYPQLGLADHMPAWTPHPLPPGWDDETAVNAPLRRSTRAGVRSTTGEQQDPADSQPSAPERREGLDAVMTGTGSEARLGQTRSGLNS
jgi:hypothetical protein